MDRKKELKQRYIEETTIEAGVYQIKNTKNQRIFIGSTKNLKTLNGVKFSLETGTNYNKELQEEWNQFGKDAFTIEVLEILKKKDEPYFNEKEALAELENKWLEKLQPYGELGYNRIKSR
jgi:excinuclease UvrABC nuclease subunit